MICSANVGCTAAFEPTQAQGRGECCATGGGVAYTDSAGRCLQCESIYYCGINYSGKTTCYNYVIVLHIIL